MTWTGRDVGRAVLACMTVCLAATAGAAAAAAQMAPAAGARAEVPFAIGPFELTTAGAVEPIASRVGLRTPYAFSATVARPLKTSGLWLGTSIEGAPEMDSSIVRPVVSGGLWRMVHGVRVGIDATSHVARLGGRSGDWRFSPEHVVPDTGKGVRQDSIFEAGTGSHAAFWSDVEGRVSWRLGRASLDAVLGMRPAVAGFRPAVWSRLGWAYPVTNRIGLVGAVGAQPARHSIGVPATRFASLAVRLTPWSSPKLATMPDASASAFTATASGNNRYRITYRVPNASSVEMSGDFVQWRPVALREVRPGVWETTLPLAAGTYHVNVRVDGERWLAPAGLPQAQDDFNGTVGVLVVR